MSTSRSFDHYPQRMTSEGVGELLGRPAATIRRWRNAGMVPASKNPGSRIWQFNRDELLAWLRSDATRVTPADW
jgi:phage terminase Nu1 subunit (DNA packaging protein)